MGRLLQLDATLLDGMKELAGAVRNSNCPAINKAFEGILHTVGQCAEDDQEIRRLLFSEVINGFLGTLRGEGANLGDLERVRVQYIRDFAVLRTMEDILAWFHKYVAPLTRIVENLRCSPDKRIAARACAIVGERMAESISRADIARELGMSESHFGKIFSKHMGMPFREYVQLARIACAQQLLLKPNHTISGVAVEVGYADASSFTRAFSKICGAPPIAYRKAPREFKSVALPER